MSINTKLRLTVLASAFVLVAAAPAAFAQSTGTWSKDIHTDAASGSVSPDDAPASHSRYIMEKKVAPSSVATNTGTWYGDIHTDAAFGSVSPDNLPASHSRNIMEKKIVPSNPGAYQAEESKRYGPNS